MNKEILSDVVYNVISNIDYNIHNDTKHFLDEYGLFTDENYDKVWNVIGQIVSGGWDVSDVEDTIEFQIEDGELVV